MRFGFESVLLRVHAVPAFFPVSHCETVSVRGFRYVVVVPRGRVLYVGELVQFAAVGRHERCVRAPVQHTVDNRRHRRTGNRRGGIERAVAVAADPAIIGRLRNGIVRPMGGRYIAERDACPGFSVRLGQPCGNGGKGGA